MKSKYIAILLVILGFTISFAQQININVNNFVGKKAVLSSLEGEKITFIDTIYLSDEGKIEFNFNDIKNRSGIYRLLLTNKKCVPIAVADALLQRKAKEQVDKHLG